MKHADIWSNHTRQWSVTDIIRAYQRPSAFQTEFAALIDSICKSNAYVDILEAGCEAGTTCLLTNRSLRKSFLDFNSDILGKLQQACSQLGVSAVFHNKDMFAMGSLAGPYDLVFNSGVLEHYTFAERIDLLNEFSRVLKPNGAILIGIPNHYCLPYRLAYLLRKRLLRGLRWPWPEESKIYDLRQEIAATGMRFVERRTLAKSTAFNFWGSRGPIRRLVELSDRILHFEGYLTTVLIRKS